MQTLEAIAKRKSTRNFDPNKGATVHSGLRLNKCDEEKVGTWLGGDQS